MAREFPRFLYSDPQNTKSKGPFIYHTIYPRLLLKLNIAEGLFHPLPFLKNPKEIVTILRTGGYIHIQIADNIDGIDNDKKIVDVALAASEWFQNTILNEKRTNHR